MYIGKNSRILTEKEEQIINNVFEEFKKTFPMTNLYQRKEIIGIGEPNKNLFCYFIDNEGFKVKFKSELIPIDAYTKLTQQISDTINLFQENDFINGSKKTCKDNNFFTQDDISFLKILSRNVDPKTGEIINISDESLRILENIIQKALFIKEKKTIQKITKETKELIINEYLNNVSLNELATKYNVKLKRLKAILCEFGLAKKPMFISQTYIQTVEKSDKNKTIENIGSKWTKEEDESLIKEYTSGISITEIAKMHKRGVGGIKARLVKHGFANNQSDLLMVYLNKN